MAGDGPKKEHAAEHFALLVWMKTEFTFESNSVVSHFFNGYPELNIGVMLQIKLTKYLQVAGLLHQLEVIAWRIGHSDISVTKRRLSGTTGPSKFVDFNPGLGCEDVFFPRDPGSPKLRMVFWNLNTLIRRLLYIRIIRHMHVHTFSITYSWMLQVELDSIQCGELFGIITLSGVVTI